MAQTCYGKALGDEKKKVRYRRSPWARSTGAWGHRKLAPKMAETADFELVQAVRGRAGRISDPSARMTSKMDRSEPTERLG